MPDSSGSDLEPREPSEVCQLLSLCLSVCLSRGEEQAMIKNQDVIVIEAFFFVPGCSVAPTRISLSTLHLPCFTNSIYHQSQRSLPIPMVCCYCLCISHSQLSRESNPGPTERCRDADRSESSSGGVAGLKSCIVANAMPCHAIFC